jgi:hypothetical protein
MTGIQTSLKTLFLISAYVAICCLVYVHSNLWIGTLVVLATIIWLTTTTIHAFRHHNYFSIGFSLCAWAWLVFWLGFYSETPASVSPPPASYAGLAGNVFRVMTLFRDSPDFDPSLPVQTYGFMHSLHMSGPMAYQTGGPYVPSFNNAMRLAICVTSLLVGLIGGTATHYIRRLRD